MSIQSIRMFFANILSGRKELKEKRAKVGEVSRFRSIEQLADMYKMLPEGFREYVADLFSLLEYKVTIMPETHDIILTKGNKRFVVTVKLCPPESLIDIESLRELRLAKAGEKADRLVYVTTGDFTQAAWDFAKSNNNNNISLINGEKLFRLINSAASRDLLVDVEPIIEGI